MLSEIKWSLLLNSLDILLINCLQDFNVPVVQSIEKAINVKTIFWLLKMNVSASTIFNRICYLTQLREKNLLLSTQLHN